MKKKIIIFLISILVLVLIPKVGAYIRSYRNKSLASKIVRDNIDFLNNSIKNGSYKDGLQIEGVKDIRIFETYEGSTYIDYFAVDLELFQVESIMDFTIIA